MQRPLWHRGVIKTYLGGDTREVPSRNRHAKRWCLVKGPRSTVELGFESCFGVCWPSPLGCLEHWPVCQMSYHCFGAEDDGMLQDVEPVFGINRSTNNRIPRPVTFPNRNCSENMTPEDRASNPEFMTMMTQRKGTKKSPGRGLSESRLKP